MEFEFRSFPKINKECFISKCGTKLGINYHYYNFNYISKATTVIYGY